MIFGAAFLGVKVVEYTDKFTHNLVPGPHFEWTGQYPAGAEIFYSLYFCMTGLHAVHMIIGLGMMSVIAIMAWRGKFDADYYTPVEVSVSTGTSSTSSGSSCSRCSTSSGRITEQVTKGHLRLVISRRSAFITPSSSR